MSVDGEETTMNAREYTRESLGESKKRRKRRRERETDREEEPWINDRVGKRGTERPKRAGKASDMSKREQLLGSPRERENSLSRAERESIRRGTRG